MFEIILFATILDLIFGEPPILLHPVVYIGKLIEIQKNFFKSRKFEIFFGFLISLSTILITILILHQILNFTSKLHYYLQILIFSILLKTTFSVRLMKEIAEDVEKSLEKGNLEKARKKVSEIVSRDTENLHEEGVISAACESVAESITDSIASPILYYSVFGLYGAFTYRVINTLDSMIGYENLKIGTFSARLDDFANFIPSRISAILIFISGFLLGLDWKGGLKIFLRDRKKTKSPNAGNTMALMAGILRVKFEKKDFYVLGDEIEKLEPHHISKALKVMMVSTLVLLALIFILEVVFWKV